MLKLCGKSMKRAKNGADRGVCSQLFGHSGLCSSETCSRCGIKLTFKTARKQRTKRMQGPCKECAKDYYSQGHAPRNYQIPGKRHIFPCGCIGVLPKGAAANKFSFGSKGKWFVCRVSKILSFSSIAAKNRGYVPIPRNTPHLIIRKMMDEPNCERCGEPLKWEFGIGKTPHLHHNHETGEIYGFTHSICNPRAMQNEIERLRRKLSEKI